jgi:hypothetical protein
MKTINNSYVSVDNYVLVAGAETWFIQSPISQKPIDWGLDKNPIDREVK